MKMSPSDSFKDFHFIFLNGIRIMNTEMRTRVKAEENLLFSLFRSHPQSHSETATSMNATREKIINSAVIYTLFLFIKK